MGSIFLLLLLQLPAAAADDQCYATASTQMALNRCASVALETADSRLEEFVRL